MSNFYEERATMIAARDLQEFVPFGRDHCKHHPNALNLQLRQLQPASELWSSDGAAGLENWQLRKGVSEIGEDVDYDEELYVAGNMVIWSKGSKSQALAVYKAFTVDSPVQQTLREVETGTDGDNFHANSIDICLSSQEPLPTMFSMLHPLDEITPLVCKSGSNLHYVSDDELFNGPVLGHTLGTVRAANRLHVAVALFGRTVVPSFPCLFGSPRVQYVVDHAMKIVFLNTDPSIVMTYDAVQNVHSVWTLRRVRSEEENVVLKFSEQGGTPQNVATSSSLTAHLRSLSKGDSPVTSPFQNYSSIHSQSRSTSSPSLHSRSPSISNMAALSRVPAPVTKIDTMLVLEGSGNLVLYTGVVRVSSK
ncbi:Anaphase-promoting complex subunit 1 [Saguinus oedipus]|uniref:Anaphase-promoting complex subunit 1 n=1 Tax=Saguinus oedipus TaxID=9490 RepID=A0ABQ9U720_SAGOE|nr:Anaphase-promoting complex subunit 1 [Saguinus oedipus]